MKREMVWILGAGLLLAASPAFADGDPDPGAPAPAPASGGGAAAASGSWSTDINDRPLVLDPGKLEIHAQLPILAFSETVPDGMGGEITDTETFELLNLGASYGIAPKIEVGLDYVFLLHPNGDITSGELGLHGAYAAYHTPKMDLAIAAALNLNYFGDDTEVSLSVGAWFRYRLTPKLSLFTGQPATPYQQDFGLGTLGVGLPTNQLYIGLNDSQPVSLSLPVGVGFQAIPQLFLFASTDIANIYFTNGPKSVDFIFADFIPIALGGYYSVTNQLDLGITFSDDLEHAGDFYAFTFGGRYFIK